jgi:hypothetical protein
MRILLATTCLTPMIMFATSAIAETTVITKQTTGISTSTIKAGAADDIKITSAGSVVLTAGNGVTIDSANKVANEGAITISNANGASGIVANAGVASGISNIGTITLDESYVPVDADKDGDLDGPFATGSNRAGVRTLGGFTGAISNTGTITVAGNDSYGIVLGGPLNGALTNNGSVKVVGDRSVGVKTGEVVGAVRLAGTISAQGKDASAAIIGGDITGALVVQGALSSTGYRSTTLPADTSKLDADDLLQGGPALVIGGNVTGGIILAIPPKDASTTDADEDKDGIEDAKEGSAAVASYGSAAAILVGSSSRDVAVGAVAGNGNGHGLVIDGGVLGSGVYAGVDANAIVIGGQGGAVTIAGGMSVNGSVQAVSNGAIATGLRIGAGASVPEVRVAGTISATGGGTGQTTAVKVDAGATLGAVRNSGKITAVSGATGSATAIMDRSGTLVLIENSGAISATGAAAGKNIAIDLSTATAATTVRQTAVATGITAPSIAGDILFGSGSDLFDVADGSVVGTTQFGAGDNRLLLGGDATYAGAAVFGAGSDSMTLGGTSSYAGAVDFGGGADSLTLNGSSVFTGSLANSAALAVNIAGGTLNVLNAGPVALGSLSVGAAGVIGITIDPKTGASTLFNVAGNANFVAGSKIAVNVSSIAHSEGRYVFLNAGSITGGSTLTSSSVALPYLFKSVVTAVGANQLAVDVTRKTTTELGLNRSETSAFPAIYAVLDKDAAVAGAFLKIGDGDTLRSRVRQMLPDHAGGTFEAVTSGDRAIARLLADPNAPFSDQGKWGFWLQQVAWGTAKSIGDTAGYDITGWGMSGGAEAKTGFGNFGLSLAYLNGKNADDGSDNEVTANQYSLAAYWRGTWDNIHANARVSASHISFDSARHFGYGRETGAVERDAESSHNGRLISAGAGISHESWFGMLSVRPIASIDYYKLRENGYSETGGGKAFDLTVDKRNSDELTVSGSVATALNFGGYKEEQNWFRVELEGGRRQIVGGSLGNTTARFEGGQAFTLVPDERTNGWTGRLRASGGATGFIIGGELSAEQQQSRAALALRVNLQIGL